MSISSFFEDLLDYGAEDSPACRIKAKDATAPLDAQTAELSREWTTTGFYPISEMNATFERTRAGLIEVIKAVDKTVDATLSGSIITRLRYAQETVRLYLAEGNVKFKQPMEAAAKKGVGVLDAPAFKGWVISSLAAISNVHNLLAYADCVKPWWVDTLRALSAAAFDIIRWAKKLILASAGLAIDAIKAIPDAISAAGTAVSDAQSAVTWLVKNTKVILAVAAIGGVAVVGIRAYKFARG